MARRTYILNEDFPDCNHSNGQKRLSDLGDLASNQAKYPQAWRYVNEILTVTGKEAFFQSLRILSAAAIEGVYQGHGAGFAPGTPCTSFNKIVLPPGQFLVNYAIPMSYGGVIGQGVNIATSNGNDTSHLVCDHAGWIDPDPVRAIVRSVAKSGYLEGATLDMVRLDGRAGGWRNSGYTQHGAWVGGMGEGTTIGRVYAHDNNNHGVHIYGAGPGRVLDLSAFDNNEAGLRVEGTNSLGGIDIGRLSTDNNGYSLQLVACGAVSLRHLKCETGLSNQRGKPFKAQVPIFLSGWADVNVDILTFATSGTVDAIVHINNTANTGNIRIGSLRATPGAANLVIDHRTNRRFYFTNGFAYSAISVEGRFSGTTSQVKAHNPADTNCDMVLVPSTTIASNDLRLGIVTSASQYDYMAWTPKWDSTGGQAPPVDPPQATATWVVGPWGPWSECVSEQQTRTRTVTSSIPGQTPTEPLPPTSEMQACTVTPPPTTGAVHSLDNVSILSPSDSIPVPAFSFKRVVLSNVTFTDTPNYGCLCVQAGGVNKGVVLLTTGKFRSPVASEMAVQTPSTVVAGTKYAKVEMRWNAAITTDRLFAYPSAGNALRMSADRIEFHAN